jgi:colicin import membrane protein
MFKSNASLFAVLALTSITGAALIASPPKEIIPASQANAAAADRHLEWRAVEVADRAMWRDLERARDIQKAAEVQRLAEVAAAEKAAAEKAAADKAAAEQAAKAKAAAKSKPKPVASRNAGAPTSFGSSAAWAASPKARAVANCESGGNPSITNPSGKYQGKWQMDDSFWRSYGGLAFASDPHYATEAQQDEVAYRGWLARGWQPWSCA